MRFLCTSEFNQAVVFTHEREDAGLALTAELEAHSFVTTFLRGKLSTLLQRTKDVAAVPEAKPLAATTEGYLIAHCCKGIREVAAFYNGLINGYQHADETQALSLAAPTPANQRHMNATVSSWSHNVRFLAGSPAAGDAADFIGLQTRIVVAPYTRAHNLTIGKPSIPLPD